MSAATTTHRGRSHYRDCPPLIFSSRSCARVNVGAIISASITCFRASSFCPACKSASARSACALALSSGFAANATRNAESLRQCRRPSAPACRAAALRFGVERIDRHHALQHGPGARRFLVGIHQRRQLARRFDVRVRVPSSALRARAPRAPCRLSSARRAAMPHAGCLRRAHSESAAPPSRTPRSRHPDSTRASASPSAICAAKLSGLAAAIAFDLLERQSGRQTLRRLQRAAQRRVALVERRVEALLQLVDVDAKRLLDRRLGIAAVGVGLHQRAQLPLAVGVDDVLDDQRGLVIGERKSSAELLKPEFRSRILITCPRSIARANGMSMSRPQSARARRSS